MKKMNVTLLFCCCFLFTFSAFSLPATAGAVLAEKGKICAKVVLLPDAGKEETFAGKFLEKYLEKITGGKMPSGTQNSLSITLATVKNAAAVLPEDMVSQLKENGHGEAFYIRISPAGIYIGGNTPQGVLYGVFTFVEKYLGVRWFHAGKDGEHCPKTASITLASCNDFQFPAFTRRSAGGWHGSVAPWDIGDYHIWQIRNKMQVRTPQMNQKNVEKTDERLFGNMKREYGNHMTFLQAVPDRLFKTHPEYFPLQKGKRTLVQRSQRCLSNPEVQKKVIDYGVRKGREGDLFGVGFHDSIHTWCECENCIRMGTCNGKYSLSNIAHKFAADMTKKILQACPDAGGQRALIYANFRELPDDPSIRYDERVMVLYCSHGRCYVHPLNSPGTSCNTKFLRDIKEWKKRCPYMGIYDYYAYSNSPYCPLEYILAEDLKYYYHTLNLRAFYDDNTNKKLPITESNWQFHYVLAKLLWNPDLDMDKLMDETYTLYYGKAAPIMKKYHAVRRQLWENLPGHVGYCISNGRYRYCIPDDKTASALLAQLRSAIEMVKGEALYVSRIRRDEKFLREFWIKDGKTARDGRSAYKQSLRGVYAGEGKVKIDGSLDEEVWKKAPPVKGFLTGERTPPPEESAIRIAYDSTSIYIGCELMTRNTWGGKLKADAVKKDSHVYLDDSIEFFINQGNNDYYHFVVNSIGTLYDARIRDSSWESRVEVKTKVLKDRYIVEVKIPLADVRIDLTATTPVKMHFFRNCFSLQPPANEVKFGLNGNRPHEPVVFQQVYLSNAMALLNGDFTLFEKKGKSLFPVMWSGRWALYDEKGKFFHLKSGSMWSKLNIANYSTSEYLITGTVQASGKGVLQFVKSSCIREKGDKRPFRHELKETVFRTELQEQWQTYPVSFRVKKNETGFLTVNGTDAKIRSILLHRIVEKKK